MTEFFLIYGVHDVPPPPVSMTHIEEVRTYNVFEYLIRHII
jgi:hypothetical protein